MKNFHMDLIRVTEAGAISAAKWVGRGNKEQADKEATDAMRDRLSEMDCCIEIAIGEGKKDESFGLFEGEILGNHSGPEPNGKYSIAVDPIEGTTPTAKGGYEAMSVIAMGECGSLYKTECFYMDKIAVGPKVAKQAQIDLRNPASANVGMVAAALGKSPQHVCVCVLDRPRTEPLIKELREIGCRIKFISDCDVTACIATCVPDSGIDMYWSIGGSPEAVIAAAAMKCMGGFLQCREVEDKKKYNPDDERWNNGGMPMPRPYHYIEWNPTNDKLLSIEDLASGEVMFAATGITDGQLLKGTRFTSRGPVTNSVGMRSESGTVRWLTTEHGN
jgi:fructose-1,6-bisphosphatase II